MAASAFGCFAAEQSVEMLERIQKAEFDFPTLAVTKTSVRCPIPRVTTLVVYGFYARVSLPQWAVIKLWQELTIET